MDVTERCTYFVTHLNDELGRLDGDVVVRPVTPLTWIGVAMPLIDQVCGWTSPEIRYHPRRGALFRVCTDTIDTTTAWLADVQDGGPRYVYTSDGILVPSIDNYARIVADLLIGETLAELQDPPEMRRARAESGLEARHPQALRLLTAVQVRALDHHPT